MNLTISGQGAACTNNLMVGRVCVAEIVHQKELLQMMFGVVKNVWNVVITVVV